MSTKSNILRLSTEILTEIFLNLELPDRKNIRLTCKSFYDACNQIPIISQEKFVFRSECHIHEITKTLLSCQYLRLIMEFQGLSLDLLPKKIWTHWGDRVYSLTFDACSMNNKVMKNVIVHCQNLKYWKVRGSSNLNSSWYMELIKLLEELVEQKVIHRRLETFEMHSDYLKYWNSIIEKIFIIFPNLKTFGAICWASNGVLNIFPCLNHSLFTCTLIDKCFKSTKIERLIFDIPSDGHWLKNSSVWDLRLKEIQTSFFHVDKIIETLFDFFSHQKLLEVVCLTVEHITNILSKKLLLHILKVCPALRRLRLEYPTEYTIELNEFEFDLLLQSRLKSLMLRFEVRNSQPVQIMPNVKLPINQTLHTLIICPFTDFEINYVLMMEYFQNLKHLDVKQITDAVLQAIFKNQANLEILKLELAYYSTDFGFTGLRGSEDPSQPVYSIRKLKSAQPFLIARLLYA